MTQHTKITADMNALSNATGVIRYYQDYMDGNWEEGGGVILGNVSDGPMPVIMQNMGFMATRGVEDVTGISPIVIQHPAWFLYVSKN